MCKPLALIVTILGTFFMPNYLAGQEKKPLDVVNEQKLADQRLADIKNDFQKILDDLAKLHQKAKEAKFEYLSSDILPEFGLHQKRLDFLWGDFCHAKEHHAKCTIKLMSPLLALIERELAGEIKPQRKKLLLKTKENVKNLFIDNFSFKEVNSFFITKKTFGDFELMALKIDSAYCIVSIHSAAILNPGDQEKEAVLVRDALRAKFLNILEKTILTAKFLVEID